MMMSLYWEGITRARWSSRVARGVCALVVVSLLLGVLAQGAHAQSRRSKKSARTSAKKRPAATPKKAAAAPKPAAAATARAAAGPKRPPPLEKTQEGGAAFFHLAMRDMEQARYDDAIKHLQDAQARLPKLADHIAYTLASAQFNRKNYPAAIQALDAVWKSNFPSPLTGSAALLAGRAHHENGQAAEAARTLKLYYQDLPQPAGDALLAAVCEAANDVASAAVYYQQVYFQYPNTPEAEQASAALVRLKTTLGNSYPNATPQMMFQRADRWIRAGDLRRARAEYESLASRLTGVDRDLARIRLGATEYLSFQTNSAYSYLKSLEVSSPEAEAERLYYLAECARRLDREDEFLKIVDRIGEVCPQSPWRLKALISAGNRFLVQNRFEVYERLYRACFETFSSDPQAAYCHWKVTWSTYLRNRPAAGEMLRSHLVRYPGSEKASAALYFLGRLAEDARNLGAAKAYYDEALQCFPNHYYTGLMEERLARQEFFGAAASAEVRRFLESVVWPVPRHAMNFEPTSATRLRIERARLLLAAGCDDLAEKELRFGARIDGQPPLLAIELAQMGDRRGSPSQALRAVKSLVPGYLSYSLDAPPPAFWRILFPLPYRTELERNARLRGLDPFLVAGLIRQESEFNPQAVSPVHAYGLTQIMPSTGRALARKLGPKRFRTSMLFRPEINLRYGTTYLRTMLDVHGEQWEQTLAAYNAGASRVQKWVTWAKYREPAEFIETIPFTETRNYVMAVLRNAQIYRRLYSGKPVPLADGSSPDPVEKAATSKKSAAFERAPVPAKRRIRKK